MTDFTIRKEKIISDLDLEIQKNPDNEVLKFLRRILQSSKSPAELHAVLGRIIVDSLDYHLIIGEDLIRFEKFYSDLPN